MDIKFPLNIGQRYYDIHYKYVLNIFKYLKYNISFVDRGMAFIVTLNGKDFLFDYADTNLEANDLIVTKEKLPTFKFHAETADNVYPFPSVSFYDWDEYKRLRDTIKYNPANDHFSYRTHAYGNARQRRTDVFNMIKPLGNVLTGMIPQSSFFAEINSIRAYIHVGGHHANMCDRSESQMFALGCPVITSYIPDLLPQCATWDSCYIKCADDYSDLTKIIYSVTDEELLKASHRAKWVFENYCTPEAIDKYLKEILCGS